MKESLFFEFKVHLKTKQGCRETNQAPYHNKHVIITIPEL